MYGKYVSVSKKYHAHAEAAYNEGDLVEIQEGRPISKTKAWTVTKLRAGCFGLIEFGWSWPGRVGCDLGLGRYRPSKNPLSVELPFTRRLGGEGISGYCD
jgi:hypothetical protein